MKHAIMSQAEDMFWWGHRSDMMAPIQPPLVIGMLLGYPGLTFVQSVLDAMTRSNRFSLFISRRVER